MEFCEKCRAIIILRDEKAVCPGCGHKPKKRPKIEASENMIKVETIVVVKETDSNTYPMVEITCPNCKNKKAYFWTMQTRSADESETKFYKCTECKHTWRKYR